MKEIGNELDEENFYHSITDEEILSRMAPNLRKTYEAVMKEATPKMDETYKYSKKQVDREIKRLLEKNNSFPFPMRSLEGVVNFPLDIRRQLLRFMIYLDLKEEYNRKQKMTYV